MTDLEEKRERQAFLPLLKFLNPQRIKLRGEKFCPHISNIFPEFPISFSPRRANRWANEGGGDRDEREAESRQDTSGRQLRHRQESPRRTDVQVHRQQASPQRVSALQSPESYDQGKTQRVVCITRCTSVIGW